MDGTYGSRESRSLAKREAVPITEGRVFLSRSTLLAYGALALPLCLAEIPIILYLPAFYAQELHLGPALVGTVFLIARLWDGFSDIVIGWLSDCSISRFGRRKPWILAGAPVLIVSTAFLCCPPEGVGFFYLILWVIIFYAAFTSVKIPHLSLGTEMATDYVERSRITAFRETFTMLGNLLFVSVPLVLLPSGAPLRSVLTLICYTLVLTVPITVIPLALRVCDRPPPNRMRTRLQNTFSGLASDKILVRFAIARFIFATEEGVTNSLLVFSLDVGLRLPSRLFWSVFILYTATLLSIPLTLRLARVLEKHVLLAIGVLGQALVYGTVLIVPAGNFMIVAILWVVLGVASTAMLSIPTSILADIVDHGEETTGERRSGAYVALDNLVYKLGMAFGVGLAFGALSLIGFDPNAVQHRVVDEQSMRMLGFGLPCLLSVAAGILYLTHPITKSVQLQTRANLNSRKPSLPM